MTTLQELYEHFDAKTISAKVIVGGADISQLINSVEWGFDISQVPTATIDIQANLLVPGIAEEASVEIWVGFRLGMYNLKAIVFGSGIVSSVSYNGPTAVIECVQDPARRLTVPYYRQIEYEFDNVTAQDSVVALLGLAGVVNYLVDLDPWDIGTAVPQKLQFSNYGEAINKVSEVDGSPWYCMPTGQIRVEKRDPLPYDNPARIYYGSSLLGIAESHPTLPDAALRPRVLDVQKSYDREGVANFIEVDGAVLVTIGPNGEQNSEQIKEEVDGAPGNFASGAPWIPTPPLFQMFTLQNELIDTNAKAFSTATRYYNLKNRLIQTVQISVPLDPLLFLAMTARVIDPNTNTDNLYFLRGYRCSIANNQAVSELTLLGGPYSGTQGDASPFAEFVWKYQSFYDQMGNNPPNVSRLNLGWNADLGAKLCQDLPADVGSSSQGGNLVTGKSMVMITFDGSPSQDFDGRIVQYDWSDDQGHTKSSILPRFTVMYDPDEVSTVQMTLEVTDDTARTDSITKTVYTAADAPPSPLPDDPTMDDTLFGGGAASGPCTEDGSPHGGTGVGGKNGMALVYFVAAECVALASADNRVWRELPKEDVPCGNFISVGVSSLFNDKTVYAVFGTDAGELVLTTDGCGTGTVVLEIPGAPEVTDVLFDPEEVYRVWACTDNGRIYTSTDAGQTWTQHANIGNRIRRLLVNAGALYAFGGNTNDITTLVRVDIDKKGNWSNLNFSGDIQTAINAAGADKFIEVAAINQNSLLIGFGDGVDPLVWTNSDPTHHPESWVAADIPALQVLAAAPGSDGKFVVSTDDGVYRTDDNENFTLGSNTPVNDLSWEGLDGVYLGVKADSVTKTVDDGETQGDMLPNPDFNNEDSWADCAVGRRVKTAVVPRDDPNGAWPSKTDVAGLTRSAREALGQVGPGDFGRSYTLPNTGRTGLLIRFLTDNSESYAVTDDLSWTLVGDSGTGPDSRVYYTIVSLNGQTINWNYGGPGTDRDYAVTAYYFTGGNRNIGFPTSIVYNNYTNQTGATPSITSPCDFRISILNPGLGPSHPSVFPTPQSPLSTLGASDTGAADGSGTCPWAGGTADGFFSLSNFGMA